jgi:hypothetical protein
MFLCQGRKYLELHIMLKKVMVCGGTIQILFGNIVTI